MALSAPAQAAVWADLGAELYGLMAAATSRDPLFDARSADASEFLLSRNISAQDERMDVRSPRLLLVPVGEGQDTSVGLVVRFRF